MEIVRLEKHIALPIMCQHLRENGLFIASLRYYDVFAKVEGRWLFAERKLMVDWTDARPMNV